MLAIDLIDRVVVPDSNTAVVQIENKSISVQDCALSVSECLINIPIQSPKPTGILKELISSNQHLSGKVTQVTGNFNSKKWRRLKGKENMDSRMVDQNAADLPKLEKKRRWELKDEDDDQEIEVIFHKKLKDYFEIPRKL